jgi:hypothetical protein
VSCARAGFPHSNGSKVKRAKVKSNHIKQSLQRSGKNNRAEKQSSRKSNQAEKQSSRKAIKQKNNQAFEARRAAMPGRLSMARSSRSRSRSHASARQLREV